MDGCPPLQKLRDEPGHVATCSECRDKQEALDLLDAPETDEEKGVLDQLAADPRRVLAAARLRAGPGALRVRRQPAWAIAGAIAAACAATAVLWVVRAPRDPFAVLREAQGESRPLEVALGDVPWAPYQPRRGAREPSFDAPLRKLLEARERGRPGADGALAMLYVLRGGAGDLARADEALSRAGGDADNARGVLAYVRADFAGALDWFLRAGSRFNAAFALERLGAHDRAARLFDEAAAEKTPFGEEAARRAQEIRAAPKPSPAASPRREALVALLAAGTPAQLDEAGRAARGMPDLLALARKLTPGQLPEHARLYALYGALRARALSGGNVREVEEFARLPAVQADPLLWAPALQLAGHAHAARGEWREAQRYQASVAGACKVRGCAAENEAIALDELADLAARDGDFAGARRLQERAERLFASVDAKVQLAELHRKRAAILNEEDRPDEAAQAAGAALRELSALAVEKQALAAALEQAAQIEGERGHRLAAAELGEAALELARAAGSRDLEVDVSALLAANAVALGRPGDARERLLSEIARLEAAGHRSGVASLRRQLADVLLAQGDAAGALAEAERGLALASSGSWEWDRILLHLAHARSLRALRREGADDELARTLDEVARAAASSAEPAQYLSQAGALLGEASLAARTADALALPLDRLRAAGLHAAPAAAGWSRSIPDGACVLVLVPAGKVTLQAVARRESGEVRRIETGGEALLKSGDRSALLAGTDRCGELWLFAGAPLDEIDLPSATGVATSLTRLLAPEPREPPASALFVSAQVGGDIAAVATSLPGADRERAAIERMGARVTGLSGERATPEEALRLAADEPLLHFAVHGFEGGFLQLAGEGGRLAARDIARARLRPGARVVLSACESGAPGPGGVAWAFARAGAASVAAARGKLDDEAAARWSERFYAALGRGLAFAPAAREAAGEGRAAPFIVVK